MRLGELLFHLTRRRGMYLPDDRFASLVSLVVGFDLASDRSQLDGFQEWVAARLLGRYSNHVWYSILISTRLGSVTGINDLPPDADLDLINFALELLTEFAEEKGEVIPASLTPPS
ncbi:hypothetical protein [Actinoplanes xinjiangensis]|uniref:Uncharacterized protein n=1 Tax=Actinoplanes xinjiangensis TaxID=512350 RepID=A0A316EML6_9ACTN|nr:hypothetical protein [Actinoplanes xinjiangensis]PWK31713.1 hypothetical protein BC793_13262 [Actinoplanes xinjiangensis]GIF43912.1 hypothetical protein Axi01nite_82230 [Actinoplanes xinjiangensis]